MNDHPSAITLPLSVYRLDFRAPGAVFRSFAGSAWRGAFGRALKGTVCVARGIACRDCMLLRTCAYPYIFETPPSPEAAKMRRYTAAPHPFVLEIHDDSGNGGLYPLGLTLFGDAYRYLPYLIHAFERAGEHGLTARRTRLDLAGVFQRLDFACEEWRAIFRPGEALRPLPAAMPEIPSVPERIRIKIETPLRLRRDEHYVTPETFRFTDLFRNLLRRISMLTSFHTQTPLETDFAGLARRSEAVDLHSPDLCWRDWTRYSSRQNREMQMGGLVGAFELEGIEITEFWPYLWLGQWTHAGKGTSMGLGRYRISAVSPAPISIPCQATEDSKARVEDRCGASVHSGG